MHVAGFCVFPTMSVIALHFFIKVVCNIYEVHQPSFPIFIYYFCYFFNFIYLGGGCKVWQVVL